VPKVLPAGEQGAKSAAADKVGLSMLMIGNSPKGFPFRSKTIGY